MRSPLNQFDPSFYVRNDVSTERENCSLDYMSIAWKDVRRGTDFSPFNLQSAKMCVRKQSRIYECVPELVIDKKERKRKEKNSLLRDYDCLSVPGPLLSMYFYVLSV